MIYFPSYTGVKMKVSVKYYLVALLAGFVYAVVKEYVPGLPLTEDQIVWAVLALLTLAGVDVVQALRQEGYLL